MEVSGKRRGGGRSGTGAVADKISFGPTALRVETSLAFKAVGVLLGYRIISVTNLVGIIQNAVKRRGRGRFHFAGTRIQLLQFVVYLLFLKLLTNPPATILHP